MWLPGHQRQSPEARFLTLALRGDDPASSPALIEPAREVRDWNKVALLSARHGVSPWLLPALSRADLIGLLPSDCLAAIRASAKTTLLRTLFLAQALEEALLALGAEGIPVAVLKGPAIAERYYPEPSLRPYSDIDLLVPLPAHRTALEACVRLGYALAEDRGGVGAAAGGTCESPFEATMFHQQSGIKLDIHYDHLQIGLKPRAMDDVWRRSEPWTFHAASARILALNDLFLFLCVHLNKHGFERLIWFKDLDLIARQQGSRLDWQWLAEAARQEGVITSLHYALRLLSKLLDTPLPADALALANAAGSGLFHRLLWREAEVLNLQPGRWRRAVQFVPRDGPRGALPSLLVMGRRSDKLRALGQRLLGRDHRSKPLQG